MEAINAVYPIEYAQDFLVLCCFFVSIISSWWIHVIDWPISFKVTALALWLPYNHHSASDTTPNGMGKICQDYITIKHEALHHPRASVYIYIYIYIYIHTYIHVSQIAVPYLYWFWEMCHHIHISIHTVYPITRIYDFVVPYLIVAKSSFLIIIKLTWSPLSFLFTFLIATTPMK